MNFAEECEGFLCAETMLADLFTVLVRLVIEASLYLLVDHLVDDCMAHSCDNRDKQSVLILECIVLFPVCAVVFMNHTPYLLFAMTCFTLLYAIFLPDFRLYWEKLRVLWADFLIHEEQLRIDRGERNHVSDEVLTRITPVFDQPENRESVGAQPRTAGTAASSRTTVAPDADTQQYGRGAAPHGMGNLMYGVNGGQSGLVNANSNSLHPTDLNTANPRIATTAGVLPINRVCYDDLVDNGTDPDPGAVKVRPSSKGNSGIISSFISLFGTTDPYDGSHPPGLTNPSAVCFMNCILQTMARSPRLMSHLSHAIDDGVLDRVDHQKLQFFQELYGIFGKLTKPDEGDDRSSFSKTPIDTMNLRRVISRINDFVVSPESGRKQIQQDAGEFLNFLMDVLDEILTTRSRFPSSQEFLRNLREKCGNLSEQEIELRHQQCHDQIKKANGRESQSYIWAASCLSDLEWLAYREKKTSVISDLYEGQEVSALFCNACERISISFIKFSVLLLPIPMDLEGVVPIDACFRQLLTVSFLSGQNSRNCDFCASMAFTHHPSGNFETSTPNGPVSRPPDLEPLSPIGRVDDDPHVTVTPPQPSPLRTDGQKQMSYRYLPECLIAQLLRFDSSLRKILKRVKVSADPIDLSFLDIVSFRSTERKLYSLYGVCMHTGGANIASGHYTSYSLAEDGHWYYFNDQEVKRVGNIERELDDEKTQQSIYILFYRRVELH